MSEFEKQGVVNNGGNVALSNFIKSVQEIKL